jgi:ribonuclease P protein component
MRREWRLRDGADFARVRERGQVWRHPLLVLTVAQAPEGAGSTRMGITVSRRVGSAVVRNRVKRRLREILLVFVVRPSAVEAAYLDLAASVHALLLRAGLVSKASSELQPVSE